MKTKLNDLVLLCARITSIAPSELWGMDVVQFHQLAHMLQEQAKEQDRENRKK